MPKARVYELAKEFGVDSKTVLAKLKDMGEFVKSASSTVEAPVVRRLKNAFLRRDRATLARLLHEMPAPATLIMEAARVSTAARSPVAPSNNPHLGQNPDRTVGPRLAVTRHGASSVPVATSPSLVPPGQPQRA